jgi:hypothetical protein
VEGGIGAAVQFGQRADREEAAVVKEGDAIGDAAEAGDIV